MGLQAFLLFLAVLAGVSDTTDGSHFRGGIISWKPDESGSFKVAFTFRLAFRRTYSGYYCNQNTVNSNGIVGSGGYWIAQCIGSYYCSSLTTGSVGYRCTDFSSIEDWSQGENSFNYTFPHAGPWRIRYSSCCWISLNLGGGSWYLSSTVNLTRRSDTGKINSSPVSASSPIVRLQQNCKKIVKIPTEDADGDKVRCRWANISAECGGVCKMFKYGTLDEEHCSITYEGTGATGWYAVAIMLEDYSQSTTDFNAVSPFSSIGLQFLVDIISYSGSCYRKPYFTGSTPAADSCIEINVGSTYRASIAVKHIDSARRVIEINVVAPTGVKTTALNSTIDRYGETVYSRDLEWTPISSQRDQNIICFTAVDNSRIESDKRCITILVTGLNRASPMAILSSRYPSSFVYNNWYYYYYYYYYGYYTSWSITFDRPIKKPKNPSFIRIVINGTVIFKLDTSSSPEVTVGGNNNTVLNFRIWRYVLSMTGTYSIILEPGSVVGIGCSSNGPPTSGVNAPDLWRVYVYGYCSTGYYWSSSGWRCVDVNECVNPSFRYRRSLLVDTFKESGTRSGRQKRYIYNYLSPSPTMSIMSASSAIQASISYSLGNECHAYNTLQDPTRSVFYSLSYFYCDYGLFRGWYRFDGVGGNQIPETCPPQYSCGTHIPGWLNGTHPFFYQGIVNRTVCYNWYAGCCTLKRNILVRNCGNFYVYWLERSPGCNFRYCTDPGNSSSSRVLSSLQSTPTQHIPAPSSSAIGQGYLVPSSSMYVNSLSTQVSINPTSVQASRPSSSAINTPFVLHLPSNCQHSCVNTVGSFYCRCYEGYTLNADGKTCSDIDECQKNNGGCSHHCVNFPGSFYCSCLEGQTISSDNKTCTEPGIEVTCGEEFMQVDLDRANFRNFDPAYLHLNYQLCRATANSSHISLRTTLNGCGTTFNETNDEIRFDNVVKAEKVVVQGVVTRSFDVNIKFYCKYSKSKLVQVSFRPFGTVTGSEGGFGNFTFKMELFKSSAYRYPYTAADYPISVQLNQLLYIQYSVESFQSNLVAFADTCRATTSRDPYSSPQYVFLRNGCPEDSTISFNYSPGPVQQLSMRAFDFLADYPIVYLHCQVLACHRQTVGSRCSKGCQRSIRKKRELANQETETEQQKETETYNINSGAIKVFRISKESSDADKLQTTLVTGVSSAGGVLLIVVIVLAVIIIKKGFIKKLSRRNKVDDIYGREQQTRTNAYVNDASAEGEGDATQGRELETRDEGFLVREDIFLDGNNYHTESGC